MLITENKKENSIELVIEGRVDTNTAPQLQNAILLAFQKSNNIVLNLEKTESVSSAGLRAFLIGQKTAASKGGNMQIINCSEIVIEVLKMTGFAKILNVGD